MHGDLSDLYQEVILDHSKQPRNYRELDGASNMAKGHNPLCGDKIDIYLKLEEGLISDISFQGSGCAISTASASMMRGTLVSSRYLPVSRSSRSVSSVPLSRGTR